VKDDQVHYALVDSDSGDLIPFASVTLPDPDTFGLHEAAVLGTNLIATLGLERLNGHKPEPVEAPRRGPGRPPGAKNKPAAAPQVRTRKPNSDITIEQIVGIISEHPEGITGKQVAEVIAGGTPSQFIRKAVDNRITMAFSRLNERGVPLPFHVEHIQNVRGGKTRVLRPLP
jgi:hypothetical protein